MMMTVDLRLVRGPMRTGIIQSSVESSSHWPLLDRMKSDVILVRRIIGLHMSLLFVVVLLDQSAEMGDVRAGHQ